MCHNEVVLHTVLVRSNGVLHETLHQLAVQCWWHIQPLALARRSPHFTHFLAIYSNKKVTYQTLDRHMFTAKSATWYHLDSG